MSVWERRLWFWCSMVCGIAALISLFVLDGWETASFFRILAVVLMTVFAFTCLMYLDPALRDDEMPAPIVPELVRWYNPVGVVLSATVVIGLYYCRQPAPFRLHLAFICGFLSVFCMDMLLRPVGTDWGLMYAFYGLSIGTSVRDYQYQYPTWVTFTVFTALVFLRAHLEYTTIVAAREAAAAAAAAREIVAQLLVQEGEVDAGEVEEAAKED